MPNQEQWNQPDPNQNKDLPGRNPSGDPNPQQPDRPQPGQPVNPGDPEEYPKYPNDPQRPEEPTVTDPDLEPDEPIGGGLGDKLP